MALGTSAILEEIEPRTILLVLIAVAALTVTAAYLYVFKAPVAEYLRLHRLTAAAGTQTQRQQINAERIQQLRDEVGRLHENLYGQAPRDSANEMVSYIIGQLDALASKHQVQLVGVKPGSVNQVLMFDELPFDVEVRGGYAHLFEWLRDAERALHPLVLKEFRIATGDNTLNMTLRVVSYRPREEQRSQ